MPGTHYLTSPSTWLIVTSPQGSSFPQPARKPRSHSVHVILHCGQWCTDWRRLLLLDLPPCFGFFAFPFVSSQMPSAFYDSNTQQNDYPCHLYCICTTLWCWPVPLMLEKDHVILGSISRLRDWETTGLESLQRLTRSGLRP